MKMYSLFFFVALLSTGFIAGIFFTWTNAVTPGIGKLNDLGYLNALQSMNRVILNPIFYLAFAAPVLSLLATLVFGFKPMPPQSFRLVLAASACYFLGAFFVTFLGNIPLNNMLDSVDLAKISAEEARDLRASIEQKWNNFNLVRTLSSFIAFLLLGIVAYLKNN